MNPEVFQKHTNDEACSSRCTCPTSHHAHVKSTPHSAVYEGSHMYATEKGMKVLTLVQIHLSSSMVLLSVESAATTTSTGV